MMCVMCVSVKCPKDNMVPRSLCSSAWPGRRMALGCQLGPLSLDNCTVRKISRVQGRWLNYLIGCSTR